MSDTPAIDHAGAKHSAPANGTPHELASLCICADDFGAHAGINEAVIALAQMGRITATSAMVGGAAWVSGAAVLRAMALPTLQVGLHLDLTEQPLWLRPRRLNRLIAACCARQINPTSLRSEIDAQLDAFEDALGRAPNHVDGHQHVHQLPGVRDALLAALQARYGVDGAGGSARMPWLRITRAPPGAAPKARVIEWLGGGALAQRAAVMRWPCSRRLLGVYGFNASAERYAQAVAGWVAQAQAGDVLMCHPSTQARSGDPIASARRVEFAVLSSEAFGAMADAQGWAPAHWLAGSASSKGRGT